VDIFDDDGQIRLTPFEDLDHATATTLGDRTRWRLLALHILILRIMRWQQQTVPGIGDSDRSTIEAMMREDLHNESNRELVDELRATIEREGRITFARFMQDALYHPRYGYYRSETARPGRSGDFITSPEADPIFGHTLARQLGQMDQILGSPEQFTLLEYGAGAGTLALAILDGLSFDAPALLTRLRYEPVEINEARTAELKTRFADLEFIERLGQPSDEPITGCVLANEFLDALPVHRIECQDGRIQERYVVWRDGWFAEEPGPPSTPEIERYLVDGGIELAEGQRAEINLGLAEWMAEVARRLKHGYVIVIDYGYPAEKLYGLDYHEGTLRTYSQHAAGDDPFHAVGHQDLTAHVDFSALQRAARTQGLQVLGLTTQADFLGEAGIGELLVEAQQEPGMSYETYVGIRSAVIRMIDPGAMGRFSVLILGRDVPAEPALIGLSASL
jgi:SAM-dependent MidA family methyltransferase